MGNFSGPSMGSGGYDTKRRILPGTMSNSPRRPQPERPTAPIASDRPAMKPFDWKEFTPTPYQGATQPLSTPQVQVGTGTYRSPYGHGGAGGTDMGSAPGSPLSQQMGVNAAKNIGTSAAMNLASAVPAGMNALGMGAKLGQVIPGVVGSTMTSTLGLAGLMNSLVGMAYSAYQGSKAATQQGLTSTGTAAAAGAKEMSSNFGALGNVVDWASKLFNPYSTSSYTEASRAAGQSEEARQSGAWARTGQGVVGLNAPPASSVTGYSDVAGLAAATAKAMGYATPAQMGQANPNAPGYAAAAVRQGGVGDMSAIGGRWGGVVGHQGDPVGGNQSGNPNTGLGYGSGFAELGAPTGMAQGGDGFGGSSGLGEYGGGPSGEDGAY